MMRARDFLASAEEDTFESTTFLGLVIFLTFDFGSKILLFYQLSP